MSHSPTMDQDDHQPLLHNSQDSDDTIPTDDFLIKDTSLTTSTEINKHWLQAAKIIPDTRQILVLKHPTITRRYRLIFADNILYGDYDDLKVETITIPDDIDRDQYMTALQSALAPFKEYSTISRDSQGITNQEKWYDVDVNTIISVSVSTLTVFRQPSRSTVLRDMDPKVKEQYFQLLQIEGQSEDDKIRNLDARLRGSQQLDFLIAEDWSDDLEDFDLRPASKCRKGLAIFTGISIVLVMIIAMVILMYHYRIHQ